MVICLDPTICSRMEINRGAQRAISAIFQRMTGCSMSGFPNVLRFMA